MLELVGYSSQCVAGSGWIFSLREFLLFLAPQLVLYSIHLIKFFIELQPIPFSLRPLVELLQECFNLSQRQFMKNKLLCTRIGSDAPSPGRQNAVTLAFGAGPWVEASRIVVRITLLRSFICHKLSVPKRGRRILRGKERKGKFNEN